MKRVQIKPFNEDGWGKQARDWVKTAQRLSHDEWESIMDDVNTRIGRPGSSAAGSSEQVDSEDACQQEAEDANAANSRRTIEL